MHIGPAKTGTTALQKALYSAREKLVDFSVLYPDTLDKNDYNHGKLCALFVPYGDAPRGLKKLSEAEYYDAGKSLQERIKLDVQTICPDILILSSEWLASAYDHQDAHKFSDFIDSLMPDSIEVLLYARRPSNFFLSASQQRLRASHQFKPIFHWRLNEIIAGFQKLFASHTISVRLFERPALVGLNIVSDFAETYIPECRTILENVQESTEVNESFSAEAMAVLQNFRRVHFADQEDVFNGKTRKLMRVLKRMDAKDDRKKPTLTAEWRDFFDYGNDQALRLHHLHHITFSDFDYPRLASGQFAPKPEKCRDVADFVDIDQDRLATMITRLANSPWSPNRSGSKWLLSLPNNLLGGQLCQFPLWRRLIAC
ncbi:hypothetical protein TR2A62_0219 [Thalassobium sp. R2A62]|nr:hypothetical protein TR2A62_0219 [Thalassobium sp. R2A62]